MAVNCAQLVVGGTALLLLLLLVRAGISFGTHGMPIRKALRARPPPPPAPTFGCAFGHASSRCPVPNPAAKFVYIIITGQFYHRTRVKAMLEYVVPHLESVHIYSDVTAPEYCTTRLALPPALAAAVDNTTACRTKSRKRECAWRHAQSRWPLGLREAAKAQTSAKWFTLLDDDTFLVAPRLEAALTAFASRHAAADPLYLMAGIGWGGGGHFLNRPWVEHFLTRCADMHATMKSPRGEPMAFAASEVQMRMCSPAPKGGGALVQGITELHKIGVLGIHACDDNTEHPRKALAALSREHLDRVVSVCMKPLNEAASTLHAIFYEGDHALLQSHNLKIAVTVG